MSLKVELVGRKKLADQMKLLKKYFPEEVKAMIFEVALVDVETFAKDKANIPVDTGRLRASIHTKYLKKPEPLQSTSKKRLKNAENETGNNYDQNGLTYNYNVDGIEYDGTLKAIPEEFEVIVGTNVEYAQKINRNGGGGPNSGRAIRSKKSIEKHGILQGPVLPKGWGKEFMDKAANNGRVELKKKTYLLAKRIERLVQATKDKAKG